MKAIIHGSPAQGSSMTEIRPAYWRKYGESMKARAATSLPGPRRSSTLHKNRMPAPAAKRIPPNHRRWATQRGMCRTEVSQ